MATTYKIKSGDTLSSIAARNGTTVAALASANGISNPNKIQAGATLTIPSARTVTVAPAPAPTRTVAPANTQAELARIQSEANTIQEQLRQRTSPLAVAPASIYDGVIKSNPVVADMLKDPATKAQYDSLTPDLQGIFLQTATSLGKAIEAGKVVNPNIELTPAENQKLLDQATTELDPYYQEQLRFLKDDLSTSIGRLMTDYQTSTGREGDKFKKTLNDQAATEADNGTAFSSGRVDRENRTVTAEQQALDDAALATTRKATDVAKGYELKAGSDALRTLDIPQLTTLTATNTGLDSGGTRSLYAPLGDIGMGSVQKERAAAIQTRRGSLEQAFRSNRLLDLTALR